MRIQLVTHYYPPESNAPANRMSELARAWIAAGHEVSVVTCTPSHPGGRPFPGYANPLIHRETLDGVEVVRLGTFLAANQGVARRSLNYLSFLIAVVVNLPRLPTADVVISTSPQFFAGLAGAALAKTRRVPWVFEVRDIWPESVTAVGALRKGLATRLLERLERWAYRSADQVVAVSPAFVAHIAERGPLAQRVAVVENGVDLHRFQRRELTGDFRARHGLNGKVVVGYVGTHGMAHALETILQAAVLTRQRDDICYLMVGAGAERDRLLKLKEELALDNVIMLGHQPRDAMPEIWSSLDVSLVMLRRSELFARVIPSKMFEAMAMERPVLLAVDGHAREIVERGDCGRFVEPEDPGALAAAVLALADDPEIRARLGANGRRFVARNYDRAQLAKRYLATIEAVVGIARNPALGHQDQRLNSSPPSIRTRST